jgi:hypothetical protein
MITSQHIPAAPTNKVTGVMAYEVEEADAALLRDLRIPLTFSVLCERAGL